MQTLELLNKKINTAKDLHAVVKTMKTLAAVNIRQYERAVVALEAYRRVVDHGWQVLFRFGGVEADPLLSKKAVVIIIGTDQGMCGQFNAMIAATAIAECQNLRRNGMEVGCWCVGEKVQAALAEEGSEAAFQYHAPAGLNSVNEMVSDITHNLENYKNQQGIDFFYLCHNVISGKTGYAPTFYAILPLNQAWVMSHKAPWPSRCLPILGLSGHEMFRHLFRQHVYICIYRALVQSLAGENSARFVAMQSAEKNITEIEDDLIKLHREKRQTDITNELLDIISGFEANKKG